MRVSSRLEASLQTTSATQHRLSGSPRWFALQAGRGPTARCVDALGTPAKAAGIAAWPRLHHDATSQAAWPVPAIDAGTYRQSANLPVVSSRCLLLEARLLGFLAVCLDAEVSLLGFVQQDRPSRQQQAQQVPC